MSKNKVVIYKGGRRFNGQTRLEAFLDKYMI